MLRKIAENEQMILLAQGRTNAEIMERTEQLFKPLVDSQSIKNEPIMDSDTAKKLKKELDRMRQQGLIEARPIQTITSVTTTTTTTVNFDPSGVEVLINKLRSLKPY